MTAYSGIVNEFIQEYQNNPGILDIQRYKTQRDIIVFYDSVKLKKTLPKTYKGIYLCRYNVRAVLKDVTKKLKDFQSQKTDITVANNRNIFNCFKSTEQLCNKLLNKCFLQK